jgi:hypothetical protein
MEQWERQFQEMVETDPEYVKGMVMCQFIYLRKLDLSSIRDVLSGVAGQLRFKYPSAYSDFVRWIEFWHKQVLQEREKLNRQGDVIPFPGKRA